MSDLTEVVAPLPIADYPYLFQPFCPPEAPPVSEIIGRLKQGQRNFQNSDWASLDLSGLDFSQTDLRGTNFFNCELRAVNFTGADLRGANFSQANLRTANLSETNLAGATLIEADLCHVSFQGASLVEAKFRRNKCYQTLFCNTQLPDGQTPKVHFLVAGPHIDAEELRARAESTYKRYQQLAVVLLAGCLYLSLELVKVIFWFF